MIMLMNVTILSHEESISSIQSNDDVKADVIPEIYLSLPNSDSLSNFDDKLSHLPDSVKEEVTSSVHDNAYLCSDNSISSNLHDFIVGGAAPTIQNHVKKKHLWVEVSCMLQHSCIQYFLSEMCLLYDNIEPYDSEWFYQHQKNLPTVEKVKTVQMNFLVLIAPSPNSDKLLKH